MTRPQTKEPEQTCLTHSSQTLWGKGTGVEAQFVWFSTIKTSFVHY